MLKKIAIKTGYIEKQFANYYIMQRVEKIYEEYINSLGTINSDEFFINRLYTIKEIFDELKTLKSFSDADFAISYLEKNF